MWQFLAIVMITVPTVIWFMRDERQRAEQVLEAQARYFASAPHYRHVVRSVPDPVPMPPRRTGGVLRADRAYFDRLLRDRAAR